MLSAGGRILVLRVSPDGVTCPSGLLEKGNALLHWTLNLLLHQVHFLFTPMGPARTLDPLCLTTPPKRAGRGPAPGNVGRVLIPFIWAWWRHASLSDNRHVRHKFHGLTP